MKRANLTALPTHVRVLLLKQRPFLTALGKTPREIADQLHEQGNTWRRNHGLAEVKMK